MSHKIYFPTDEELKVIRDLYNGSTLRINKILRALGPKYPRWYIRRLANEMGLAQPKPKDWSEKEVRSLHKWYPQKSFAAVNRRLMQINGGTFRSPTAILLKARRENINKRSDGLTLRMVQELLGVDHHKIEAWIYRGLLQDKRKGTRRTRAQGGDMHHFEPEDLRALVINNPNETGCFRTRHRPVYGHSDPKTGPLMRIHG